MTWPKYVLIALNALSALVSVSQIGKPRKPLEASTAVGVIVIDVLLCWLVVIA